MNKENYGPLLLAMMEPSKQMRDMLEIHIFPHITKDQQVIQFNKKVSYFAALASATATLQL